MSAEKNKRFKIVEAYVSLMCSKCKHLTIIHIGPTAQNATDSICGNCKNWCHSDDICKMQVAGRCSECSKINWRNDSGVEERGHDALMCWNCKDVLWLYDRKSPPMKGERILVAMGEESRNK